MKNYRVVFVSPSSNPNLRGCVSSYKKKVVKNVAFGEYIIQATGQESIKRQTIARCSIEFIVYQMPRQERNICTKLFTRDRSTKPRQAFSIFRLVNEMPASKDGVTKNMRDVFQLVS